MTVKLPRVADTADEVVIVQWEKDVEDFVAAGDVLLRVETNKATVEVPSPIPGRLVEQLVAVDDEVTTGTPIAVLDSV
jgi:glutaconyl-CoA/methylmalonyl-CoA decarboxylase subunit gamma